MPHALFAICDCMLVVALFAQPLLDVDELKPAL